MPGKRDVGAKKRRRLFRELAALAHRRELEQALGELEACFRAWRSGEIDASELSDRIHEFHDGAAREAWKRYQSLEPEMSVPVALARRVLKEEDVPPELLEQLRRVVEAYRGTGD